MTFMHSEPMLRAEESADDTPDADYNYCCCRCLRLRRAWRCFKVRVVNKYWNRKWSFIAINVVTAGWEVYSTYTDVLLCVQLQEGSHAEHAVLFWISVASMAVYVVVFSLWQTVLAVKSLYDKRVRDRDFYSVKQNSHTVVASYRLRHMASFCLSSCFCLLLSAPCHFVSYVTLHIFEPLVRLWLVSNISMYEVGRDPIYYLEEGRRWEDKTGRSTLACCSCDEHDQCSEYLGPRIRIDRDT